MSIHINWNNLGHDIQRGFQQLPQQIAHVPDQLQHAGLDPHAVQDWVRHEVKAVMQGAAGEVAGIAFRKSAEFARSFYNQMQGLRQSKPDLATAIDGVGIDISLSILTLHYEGFMGRAEGLCNLLDQQAQNFQFRRSTVRWILENTGPTGITIGISGELFTSALSAGIGINAPLALAIELVDIALEHAGIDP